MVIAKIHMYTVNNSKKNFKRKVKLTTNLLKASKSVHITIDICVVLIGSMMG